MAYRCLAEFLDQLGQSGELARIDCEADAALEVAEVTRRLASQRGPALLWRAVGPGRMPVVTNLLGTEKRLCLALGVDGLSVVAERIAALLDPKRPEGWFERLTGTPPGAILGRLSPREVRSGPCQQVVRLGGDINLAELPALTMGPDEGGRSFTSGAVVTVHPESGDLVCGVFPLELLDQRSLAAAMPPACALASVCHEYLARDQKMPAAVVFGGDPSVAIAALAEGPGGVEPWALAGLLREKPLDVVRAKRVPLNVPAEAEVVFEGWIDPAEPRVAAGPFVTPLGYYGPAFEAPVLRLEAVTHRANPVLPVTVPGRPPNELSTIRRGLLRIFLPVLRLAVPGLIDCELPEFAAGRHWAAVSVRKTAPGQVRRVIHALWGMRWFDGAKVLVVVDEGVDLRQPEEVLGAIAGCAMPGRDVILAPAQGDPFDASQAPAEPATRMAIDATARLPGEPGPNGPRLVSLSPAAARAIAERWQDYGLEAWGIRADRWPPG